MYFLFLPVFILKKVFTHRRDILCPISVHDFFYFLLIFSNDRFYKACISKISLGFSLMTFPKGYFFSFLKKA